MHCKNTKRTFPLTGWAGMTLLGLICLAVIIGVIYIMRKKAPVVSASPSPIKYLPAGSSHPPVGWQDVTAASGRSVSPPSPISPAPAIVKHTGASWSMVYAKVTAYCPCTICCGDWALTPLLKRKTAGGVKLQYLIDNDIGFVAAASTIPFFTKLQVPGYNDNNPVYVLDRGGAIRDTDIDVFCKTHEEALEWGVQDIWILVFTDLPAPRGAGEPDWKAPAEYAEGHNDGT